MSEERKLTNLMFSDKQRRTVAAAVTIVCGAIIVAFVTLVFRALVHFFSVFAGVLMPLAIGALLAVLLKPYYQFLIQKLKMKPWLSVIAVFLSFLIPVGAFIAFFGVMLVEQATDLIAIMPEWYAAVAEWVELEVLGKAVSPDDPAAQEKMKALIQENWETVAATAQHILAETVRAGIGVFGWLIGLLGWFIVPVYLGFFLMAPTYDLNRLEGWLPFFKAGTRRDVIYLCREFIDILVAFFRGQIIVALAQGALFAIGFSIVGLDYGFVIGLLLGLLNIVPYLGNVIGLALALPIAYFQDGGGTTKLVLVLAIFGLVQVLEGAVLTPRIMGQRTGLHPIVIIVAMFFWGTALDGIAGMILAVPLTAFFVVFWRLAKSKYIEEIV